MKKRTVKDSKHRLVEQRDYTYNERNQIVTEMIKSGCSTTVRYYGYDADGNRVFQLNYNRDSDEDWDYDSKNRSDVIFPIEDKNGPITVNPITLTSRAST